MRLEERIFHIISNTHWDREWRYPFQRNRQMLVDMIDSVLEILENEPEYRAFHLDSQSIVIKDYLEIKPHKEEVIRKFVKEGRLLIGPWYILPDEFLVGGENLIRNLLIGHKICKKYGGVSKVGYSPFSWGQISQLPQIYKEFGIDVIMFYRGVNSLDSYNAEFIWEGADGTQALASRFSTMPRYNFYFLIYRPVLYNQTPYDVELKWDKRVVPFHLADEQFYKEDYYLISPDNSYYEENIENSVNDIINRQVNDFTTPNVIWMEGHDSSGPNAKTVQIIKDIKKKFPNLNVKHSTLEEYSKALLETAQKDKLPVVKGERRSAQNDLRCGNLYGYVTSSRTYLKLTNFKTEKLLQYYAEPFYSLSGILGQDINNNYLDIAWEYLVQNSAHDSIGGCSLTSIHDDMMLRYKNAYEISTGVFERAAKYILKNVNLSTKQSDLFIAVFNPLNYNRSEICKVYVDIPEDYMAEDFDIIYDGKVMEKEILFFENVEPVVEEMTNRPMYFKMKRFDTLINFENIPANGYKIFEIVPKTSTFEKKIFDNEKILRNEYLEVRINENGTINIFDKVNNNKFENILYFIDEGEEGHAWVHKSVKPTLTTLNEKPVVIIYKNKLVQKAIIQYNFNIFSDINTRLLNKTPDKKIEITVNLELPVSSDFLKIKVMVNNQSLDHRLRLVIPTDINAPFHYAETNFDVVKRTSERPDTSNWVEQPMYDFPFNNFVDVASENRSIAVFSDGIKEYEYKNDERNSLCFTLLRAYKYIIAPASKQDFSYDLSSQEIGKREYNFAIYPHKNDYQNSEVIKNAYKFNYDLRAIQMGKNISGNLSDTVSFYEIENKNLIPTAFKQKETKEENKYILRFYNPMETTQKTKIRFFKKFKEVGKTTLEEDKITEILTKNNNETEVVIMPKKIITLEISF